MKKFVFVISIIAALFISCRSESSDAPPLPRGMYIAGVYNGMGAYQVCYWTDSSIVPLAGPSLMVSYDHVFSISVSGISGSTVFVASSIPHSMPTIAWLDGTHYVFQDSWDFIFNNNKIYKVRSNGVILADDAQISPVDFYVRNYTVHDGTVYAAGYCNHDWAYPAYSIDADIYNITLSEDMTRFYSDAITVGADGAVYIAGHEYADDSSNKKCWYYVDGEFIELVDFFIHYDSIRRIKVSNGKFYVFGSNRHWGSSILPNKFKYFVDGSEITISLPDNFNMFALDVHDGKVYALGNRKNSKEPYTACYWVDGELHDLPGYIPYSIATAMFIAE